MTVDGDPAAPEVLSLRGRALYQSGNMVMAQRMYEEALRRDPDSSVSMRGLKRLRSQNASKEAGNAAFKQVQPLSSPLTAEY